MRTICFFICGDTPNIDWYKNPIFKQKNIDVILCTTMSEVFEKSFLKPYFAIISSDYLPETNTVGSKKYIAGDILIALDKLRISSYVILKEPENIEGEIDWIFFSIQRKTNAIERPFPEIVQEDEWLFRATGT